MILPQLSTFPAPFGKTNPRSQVGQYGRQALLTERPWCVPARLRWPCLVRRDLHEPADCNLRLGGPILGVDEVPIRSNRGSQFPRRLAAVLRKFQLGDNTRPDYHDPEHLDLLDPWRFGASDRRQFHIDRIDDCLHADRIVHGVVPAPPVRGPECVWHDGRARERVHLVALRDRVDAEKFRPNPPTDPAMGGQCAARLGCSLRIRVVPRTSARHSTSQDRSFPEFPG